MKTDNEVKVLKENLLNAHSKGTPEVKKTLETLFPEEFKKKTDFLESDQVWRNGQHLIQVFKFGNKFYYKYIDQRSESLKELTPYFDEVNKYWVLESNTLEEFITDVSNGTRNWSK